MIDLKEKITKPRQVALYALLDSPGLYMISEVRFTKLDEHYSPLPEGELQERPIKGCVRVSEVIEITFAALADDSMVQNAIASLDEAEREAIRELNAKIAALRAQKAQLLALTHQPEQQS